MADLSVQTINGIEGHRAWVSDKTLVTLADVLGVQASWLLSSAPDDKKKEENPVFSSMLISLKRSIKDGIAAYIDTRFDYFIKPNKEERKKTGRRGRRAGS
jgi:transcriptional regulator with XRE-family HTH domain